MRDHARARSCTPSSPPSRGSPPETSPLFPIARAHSVIIITAHTASPLQRTVPCPQVLVTLSSFETSKPNKPGARFV